MARKPRNCVKGFACGNSCISKAKDCIDVVSNPKKLNKLVKAIENFGVFAQQERDFLPTQKEKLASNLSKINEAAIAKQALAAGLNSFEPEELTVLAGKRKDILKDRNLIEYGESLSKKYKSYKPGSKAPSGSPNARQLPDDQDLVTDPFTGKKVHEMYYMPGSKIRNVTDSEVDAVWDTLSKSKNGKGFLDSMFTPSKGSPDRDPPNRAEIDWVGKDGKSRLRKSQLKALLEQVAEDDDGELYIHDPWSDDGKLKYFPDLDHIVPLARGGTHGTPVDEIVPPTSGYHSDNFVWISKQVNQNYKKDGTIPQTVKTMEKNVITKDAGQVKDFLDNGEWDESLAEDFNTKTDKFYSDVEKSLEKKMRDAQSFIIKDRVARQEADMLTKSEYLSILDSLKAKKEKQNLVKRVLDGLEQIPLSAGGIIPKTSKEVKSRLTSKDKQQYTDALEEVGKLLDNAAGFANLGNLVNTLSNANVLNK